ncbi:DUF1405 domain-containing protein [Chengkuizengella axinellae]|uniref:DUF1405 domain-containing protein n=1 Tax=Chengkuizengella axinellae TaxID=3064388 RepID=A0ABT9IYD2_9BACL|nr:DUF1405 domain-containing protein [Chengkuizengella sp. 2205SS18-9]MDP5273825.1 DUF1405 domain-containing protein [Chengkuizengella sp. 2205SS18-9]
MTLSFFWSRTFLLNRHLLWLLFIVNFLGTIYGYYWYKNQIIYTMNEYSNWFVFVVPDSPTASLFFTLSILYLLIDEYTHKRSSGFLRGFIEVFGVVTSVKYGIWAVVMIFAAAAQGDVLSWQDWMLTTSHLGMALEAVLFIRFFGFKMIHIIPVAIWTLFNDYVDYKYYVYPWLPKELTDDLTSIQMFTILLSIFSLLIAYIGTRFKVSNMN